MKQRESKQIARGHTWFRAPGMRSKVWVNQCQRALCVREARTREQACPRESPLAQGPAE